MIFPKPKSEQYYDQSYALKDYDGNASMMHLYDKYKSGNSDVVVEFCNELKSDEYKICVSREGVKITALDDCSVFRAISTLRQLIVKHGSSVPFCEISDSPDFEKRAYMLDISRCRMPKVETITRLIDLLAELKYNEFQLYMESFVFKYKHFPEYTKDFDCLTPEDIKYLDAYCRDRFIDFVPNQNSFGHMNAWLSEKELSHLAVGDEENNTGTLNPLMDETFDFVDKLYDSLLPHFCSEYVNIGLDEAYGLGKFQLEKVCLQKGNDTVFMDWLNKLAAHIQTKYGKKVQFWADMICGSPNAYERTPEGAVALLWAYDAIQHTYLEKQCKDLQSKNVEFYVCPGNSNWASFTGRFDLMNFNVRTCAELGRDYGAKGILMTDWGFGEGHYHFPVWSLVPLALSAQYCWNAGEVQNGENHKNEYVRASEEYIDNNIFGGVKVSRHLRHLQQYYLLEPERIHCRTMCGMMIRYPIDVTVCEPFFDLKECGDEFYFDNITAYVRKCISNIEVLSFDETLKRQTVLNAKMVILSSEICKIRIDGTAPFAKLEELICLTDEICEEYIFLWDKDNFPEGKEFFLKQLRDRKEELENLKIRGVTQCQ